MDNSKRSLTAERPFWKVGEPLVWSTAAALAMVLLAAVILVGVIIYNGIGVFWPSKLAQLEMKDGPAIMGEIIQEQEHPTTKKNRIQLKVGNRDLYNLDFRWVDEEKIANITYPSDAMGMERLEYGNFYGFLKSVSMPNPPSGDVMSQFEAAQSVVAAELEKVDALNDRIKDLSNESESIRLEKLERLYEGAVPNNPEIQELDRKDGVLKAEFEKLVSEQEGIRAGLKQYHAKFADAAGTEQEIEIGEIVRVFMPNDMGIGGKIVFYIAKIWELLSEDPREANTEGGLFPAIFGTVIMVFIMSIFSFPLGVMTAIYLKEYAKEGFIVRLVRIAVNNLAGIPSIVYGVFGLGFFVYGVGGFIDQIFYPERLPAPTFGTGGILWASMTLALLTLPVVIVATEEALGSVPQGMREASLALGATKLQTLTRVLLPMASPGIMTGFILAMARAAGEVAPLMITGVVKLAPTLPLDGNFPYFHFDRKFMHLGFHIYDVGFQSPNVEAAKPMVFVTTFLLVMIVLFMSSTAIRLRTKMKKRYTFKAF